MAPAPPRSKLSRAIIAKAREWQEVIKELPLLEEYDSLENLISASKERLEANDRNEAATKERIASLTSKEASLTENTRKLQSQVDSLNQEAKTILSQADAEAKKQAAKRADDAEAQAAEELRLAKVEAAKIIADGKAAADAYRDKLSTRVKELEKHIAELEAQEAEMSKAHETASVALTSLRKQLGVH